MQGVVLTEKDTTAIQAPMIAMVKHKFGVPSMTPSSFWFTRAGGRLPRMRAKYERRATEMTVHFCNGEGSTECGNLAWHMEQHTQNRLRFPGDPLAYPDHATTVTLSSAGQLWWPNMMQILAKRGLNIRMPAYGNEEDRSILAILEPGWAGDQDTRAYRQMYEQGIQNVSDALELDGDTIKVCQAGYRLFWE
ncbi:hypothetical protein GGI03_004648 [Coemansia sp. RSA 2337]|nr:hypothetical protein GGI03_004648 [Coemansia sp. RSA 2337]